MEKLYRPKQHRRGLRITRTFARALRLKQEPQEYLLRQQLLTSFQYLMVAQFPSISLKEILQATEHRVHQ